MPALRLTVLLKQERPEAVFPFIQAVFHQGWGKGEEIGTPESLGGILQHLGLPLEFLDRTGEAEIRREMKKNHKKAFALGVFGLPTFIVKEELFWGNDSIEQLEKFLGGDQGYSQRIYDQFVSTFGTGTINV